MAGYDVICPQCRESYHETTDTYTPDTLAEPHMVRLKKRYQEQGWSTFSPHAYGYGCMECPDCGAAYAPSGHLTVVARLDEKENQEHQSPPAEEEALPAKKADADPTGKPLVVKKPGSRRRRG